MEVAVSRASSPARAVLLVDDVIGTRAALAEVLRVAGYPVLEAATSDDALDLLNSRLEIETLIAHERVQGSMNGPALADWVRKTRPAMCVIVISGQEPSAALLARLPPVTPGP